MAAYATQSHHSPMSSIPALQSPNPHQRQHRTVSLARIPTALGYPAGAWSFGPLRDDARSSSWLEASIRIQAARVQRQSLTLCTVPA